MAGILRVMSEQMHQMPPHARLAYKGKIFEIWQWEQQMYDGSVEIFERLKRADTTAVIATIGDKILLQEQMQPDRAEPFLTLSGGRRNEGETPLEAAKRELLEETGYASDNWEPWKSYQPHAKLMWGVHYFIARDCKKIAEQNLDAGERIELRLITFEELLRLSEDDAFRDRMIVPELWRMRTYPEEKDAFRQLLFRS